MKTEILYTAIRERRESRPSFTNGLVCSLGQPGRTKACPIHPHAVALSYGGGWIVLKNEL